MSVARWLLLVLAAGCFAALRGTHRRRMQAERPRATPRSLQRWEGEGGGVPVGDGRTAASQVHHDDSADPLPRGMP